MKPQQPPRTAARKQHRKVHHDRREAAVRIQGILREKGLTIEAIAARALLAPMTVRNTINGACTCGKTRLRITSAVGCELWPNLRPAEIEDMALLESKIASAADLRLQELAAKDDTTKAALRAKRAALATSELRQAKVRLGHRLTVALMLEIVTVFAPAQSDFLLGIQRVPGDTNRVRIGTAATAPEA